MRLSQSDECNPGDVLRTLIEDDEFDNVDVSSIEIDNAVRALSSTVANKTTASASELGMLRLLSGARQSAQALPARDVPLLATDELCFAVACARDSTVERFARQREGAVSCLYVDVCLFVVICICCRLGISFGYCGCYQSQ
jgi:hypothetical protein